MKTSIYILLTAAAAVGCDTGTGASTDPDGGGADGGGRPQRDASGTPPRDFGVPPPADASQSANAEYGAPCRSNLDCGGDNPFCVATVGQGPVCSRPCTRDDQCPPIGDEDFACRINANSGRDRTLVCAPRGDTLCAPCFDDANCFGGRCVELGEARICGIDCGPDDACPDGYECQPTDSVPQCLPIVGSCDCDASREGEVRPCVRSDDGGRRCVGEETCDPAVGWVGCDAQVPADETCNGIDDDCNGAVDDSLPRRACEATAEGFEGTCAGVAVCEGEAGFVCNAQPPVEEACDLLDNDCDGSTDEDFTDDQGRYTTPEHCGACGNDCTERFALAAETACEVDEQGAARCVVVSCIPGYTRAGPTACIPLDSSLCQPCELDVDCNAAVGDRCVSYGELSFCGRDCGPDSVFGPECPPDYACGEDGQCRLEQGTCLCGPQDAFVRPCRARAPGDDGQACVGRQTCEAGVLGACELPGELCNELDDDCNGEVDEGFRDPDTGDYTLDDHCGRCNFSCGDLFAVPAAHADGRCVADDAPHCEPVCHEGFVNADGRAFNGCECALLDPERDAPDLEGIDANCDGVDGEVPRAVFVATTGDDGNPGTLEAPVRTIGRGVALAVEDEARDHVYVASGVYSEAVLLAAGVEIYGGYSLDFHDRNVTGNETAIFGPAPDPEHPGAVSGLGIQAAVLDGFTVVGFDIADPSASSYGVYLRNCGAGVVVRNCVVRAGDGGNGLPGAPGDVGASAPAGAGAGSVPRAAAQLQCVDGAPNISAGGAGVQHVCPAANDAPVDVSGGGGGNADCPTFNVGEGSGANGRGPGAGAGGAVGFNQELITQFPRCFLCLIPGNGTEVGIPGEDGDAGPPGGGGRACGAAAGSAAGGRWTAPGAGAGVRGSPGGGGGGGGAGSGVEIAGRFDFLSCPAPANESIGGGGGGGGAGGCGGDGGGPGDPGGGSFAVFVVFDAAPEGLPGLENNTIERGTGGFGGDGGAGAEGGAGSSGREALDLDPDDKSGLLACSDPGGRGGDGGDGGPGGGGGGGCGGPSVGIFVAGAPGADAGALRAANRFPGTGAAGAGGRGGISIGNPGGNSGEGLYSEVEVVP